MKSRFVALENIADVSAGNPAPQGAADFSEDGQPFVRMQDVGREHHTRTLTQTADKLTADAIRRNRLRLYPAGTLLIPKSGASINLNHRALLARDAYVVSHLATVVPDTSLVDAEYLYFWSLTYDPRGHAQTTSLPSLPTSLIKSAQIPLPSLPEQRRIVDLLSRAEGIVRLRREAQCRAAELVPALFLDMFGDPAGNPKRWPVVRIGSLTSVQTGATPRREEARFFNGGTVAWIKTTSVIGEQIYAAEDFITESAVAETNCKVFPVGTILVAMYGQGKTRGRVGILAIPAATNQACAAILPTDKIEQSFLFHALRMQYERLRAMGRGGNQANLNLNMIKELQVPLPLLELQRAFATKAETIRAIAARQATALATAQATFDALLQQAFAARQPG